MRIRLEILVAAIFTPLPMRACLFSNGRFAIAPDDVITNSAASYLLTRSKESGAIPDDSFKTGGDACRRKVCCK